MNLLTDQAVNVNENILRENHSIQQILCRHNLHVENTIMVRRFILMFNMRTFKRYDQNTLPISLESSTQWTQPNFSWMASHHYPPTMTMSPKHWLCGTLLFYVEPPLKVELCDRN